jgi:hypothetical protein
MATTLGVLNTIEIEQLLHSEVIGGIGCISGRCPAASMDTPSTV